LLRPPAILLSFFYLAYEKAIGRNGDEDSEMTTEDVAGFKRYLLGGGQNWKEVLQNALRSFYSLSDKGVRFNLDDGSTLDNNSFEAICSQIKDWVERNGGETKYGGCYVATAVYGSYECPQVWVLRRYRDDRLSTSAPGRAFIRCYYAVSPSLVRTFGKRQWFTRLFKARLDKLVERLVAKGVSDAAYYD
jgi:hypothetical protein